MQSERVRFDKGEEICRQGEPAAALFILRRGRVAVEVGDDEEGDEVVVVAEIADPGAILGEAGLFLELRTATVRALEEVEVEVVRFERGGLRKLFQARPDTALKLCRALALRLRNVSERLSGGLEAAETIGLLYDSFSLSYLTLTTSLGREAAEDPALGATMKRARRRGLYRDAQVLREQVESSKRFFSRALTQRSGPGVVLTPGFTLLTRGEVGQIAYLIERGEVELRVGAQRLVTLGPGELIGGAALLLGDRTLAATELRASEDLEVRSLSAAGFEWLIAEEPDFLYDTASSLCRCLESANMMAFNLPPTVAGELDLLAASPRSCEAAFLEVAEALEEARQLPALAARARVEAERAGEARRRMTETFAHLLTLGSAAAAT